MRSEAYLRAIRCSGEINSGHRGNQTDTSRTKWNASETRYSTTDPERVIWLDTPWDPPVPVLETLAKRFPEHEIVVYSDEDMNHLHVTFTLKEVSGAALRAYVT